MNWYLIIILICIALVTKDQASFHVLVCDLHSFLKKYLLDLLLILNGIVCPVYLFICLWPHIKYVLTQAVSIGTLHTMDTLYYFSRCFYTITLLSLQKGMHVLSVAIEEGQANCVDPWCLARGHLLLPMCTSCGFADVALHPACGPLLQDSD